MLHAVTWQTTKPVELFFEQSQFDGVLRNSSAHTTRDLPFEMAHGLPTGSTVRFFLPFLEFFFFFFFFFFLGGGVVVALFVYVCVGGGGGGGAEKRDRQTD